MNRSVNVPSHEFDYIDSGYKTFIQEIRKEHDVYKPGDIVTVKEFDYDKQSETGRELTFIVGYGISQMIGLGEVFYTYSLKAATKQ